MPRQLTPNRWNWCQEQGKWVYIELNEKGNKVYYYQIEPPKQFIDLTHKIKILNEKLQITNDHEENDKIFSEMMRISKRMQSMRKENSN
ncbi:MAG: hypothetical protein ACFE9T_09695 [Promethearchaeota archaeon]